MDPQGGGNDAVRKADAPGQRSRNSVIAVARKEAPHPSTCQAERRDWRHIQNAQDGRFVKTSQQNGRSDAAENAAKPCVPTPKTCHPVKGKWILPQSVPLDD